MTEPTPHVDPPGAPPPPPPSWGEEAKRIGARAAVIVGALATFALFAGIVLPGIRREMQEPRSWAELAAAAQSSVTTGWLDPAEAPAEKGRVLPPVDPDKVLTPRPELLARGKELYQSNCVPCHGESGQGDGLSAATLNPKPRNFTAPAGWTNGFRVADIYRTISQGVKGTGMTAYDFLAPVDRMALVHQVRSLGTFDHGQDDTVALDALREQFGSAGGRVPNRIPVSAAIARLEGEAPRLPALDTASAGALVRSAVRDPARAARAIARFRPGIDAQLFARSITAGAPANGFATTVAGLTAGEWQALQAALIPAEKP